MKIGIVGTGYVGLVTAAGLAELGHNVIGTDVDRGKIDSAKQGIPHIYEPGLESLLRRNLDAGRLSFEYDLMLTIQSSDVLFVCVNTPQREDGSADMSYIERVSRFIAECLNGYKLVVEKSTVPVQTSSWIKRTISLNNKGEFEIDVASNPEFLREGSAVSDFLNPDRIIVGVESERAKKIMLEIYQVYEQRILVTNIDTAELIKHASNSFLATKISFINLISDLCEKTDADIEMVAEGMGLDPRIGGQFLKAGLGYGGSCFPKDVRALINIGEDLGIDASLLREVDRVNQNRIQVYLSKLRKALWNFNDKNIAVLGLSFKPETDDIRNAPSIPVIEELVKEGANLQLYDPQAMDNMRALFPPEPGRLQYSSSPYEALEGANAALFITEWDEFKELDLEKVKTLMATPLFIDGRNIFLPELVGRSGFEYYSVGRKDAAGN